MGRGVWLVLFFVIGGLCGVSQGDTLRQGGQCQSPTIGGTTYDLSRLASTPPPVVKSKGRNVRMSICNRGGPCNSNCCLELRPNSWINCGSTLAWEPLPTPSAIGVQQSYTNGMNACEGKPFTMKVQFICDCDAGVGKPSDGHGADKCGLSFDWKTDQVCGITCFQSTPSGLSWGWQFNIALLILITVYCCGGIFYKRRTKGFTGAECIPNVNFWRDFPHLVGDGIRFTKSKFCSRSGSDGI